MTWPSHDLTPQQTSRHQNTSLQSTKHHHHGTAEGSFTAKKWFGHRAGRSPCAHSIGKFFLCYIVLFLLETSAPGLSGHYWYNISTSCILFLFLSGIKLIFFGSKPHWSSFQVDHQWPVDPAREFDTVGCFRNPANFYLSKKMKFYKNMVMFSISTYKTCLDIFNINWWSPNFEKKSTVWILNP